MTKKNLVADFEKALAVEESDDTNTVEKVCFFTLVERVLRILNDGIEKLKVALVLPYLLSEECVLRQNLSPTNYRKLIKYCEKYTLVRKNESDPDVEVEPLEIHLDFRLLKAIEIVYDCPKIRSNLNKYLEFLPDMSDKLLKAMINMQQIASTRLRTTPNIEMARERLSHYIYHENEKNRANITALNAQFREKEINLRWKIAAKQSVIKKYQELLAFRKWENSIKVKKEIGRANKEMDTYCHKNEQLRVQCKEEVEAARIKYHTMLKANTEYEETIQAKKNAVKKELEDWIKKYDTDILEKVIENDALDEEIETVQGEFNEFMLKFYEQEKIYAHLFRKKAREDKRILEEKMLLFMMVRAAKTIQRYWREYLRTHKKRRRGKGKAGKEKKAKGKKK